MIGLSRRASTATRKQEKAVSGASGELTDTITPRPATPDQSAPTGSGVEDTAHANADADEAGAGATAADGAGESAGGARNGRRNISWSRVVAYGVLPALALLLALAAGWLKWQDSSTRTAEAAGIEAARAAGDGTVALLSYGPDTVEKDLVAAQSRLTGNFRDSYTSLTRDVVIPGARQKQISAVANVPAAAVVSATANHAVVLLAVNQSVIVGKDAPSATASSVRVTLDKIGDRWLISGFDPV